MFMSTRYKKKDPAWRKRQLFSLEDSLAKLFECLTIEYSCGKLISPKYKHFRSQKIDFEQKTRLNNALWRAWHIQYILSKRARFFMFDPPFSDQTVHSTPQAVILEGKYWKKRLDTVSTEYKKWRRIYPFKFISSAESARDTQDDLDFSSENIDEEENDESDDDDISKKTNLSSCDGKIYDTDNFFDSFAAASDLPDTLFSSLETQRGPSVDRQVPAFFGNSSVIQPTLDTLNPCFDELIDNFDWLAPEWNFTRTLDTVAESPAARVMDLISIDESPIITDETISTPASVSVGTEIRDQNSECFYTNPSVPIAATLTPTISNLDNANKNTPSQFSAMTYDNVDRSNSDTNVMIPNIKEYSQRKAKIPVCQVQPQSGNRALRGLLGRVRNNSFSSSDIDEIKPATQYRPPTNVVAPPGSGPQNIEGKTRQNVYQSAPSRFSGYAELPPQLQAPNLTAHLQAVLANRETESIPRNKSDTHLPRLDSTESQKAQPARKTSGTRKELGLIKSKRAKLTRNVSDSNLNEMGTETTRSSRRYTNRSSFISDTSKKIPRNFSDSNLAGISSVQHPRKILPKNCIAILPLANTNVACLPGYPGQGPTYVVNRQPPGHNEAGTARIYMPKVPQANTLRGSASASADCSTGSINAMESSNQATASVQNQGIQGEAMIYQLARDGKNILPFKGFVNEGLTATSASCTPTIGDPVQLSGHVPSPQTGLERLESNIPPSIQSVGETSSSSTVSTTQTTPSAVLREEIAPPSPAVNVVMPLQGLTDQQLVTLAKLLESGGGQQHKQATIAYLELLQQQLNTLLVQQQHQMLRAQQQRLGLGTDSSDDKSALPAREQSSSVLPSSNSAPSALLKALQNKPDIPLEASNLLNSQISESLPRNGVSVIANTKGIQGLRVKVTPRFSGNQDSTSQPCQPVSTPVLNRSNFSSTFPVSAQNTLNCVAPVSRTGSTVSGSQEFLDTPKQNLQFTNNQYTSSGPEIGSSVAQASSQGAELKNNAIEIHQSPTMVETTKSLPGAGTQGKRLIDKEKKRMSHISAEKRRRGNIKNSFDMLMHMVPTVQAERPGKSSKANMLERAAEYVLFLHREKNKNKERIDALTQEIAEINTAINVCQNQLPATGAPSGKKGQEEVQASFFAYVKEKIASNYKYWIFSLVLKPLFNSFNTQVSTESVDEFINSVLQWLDQHCSLPALRPAVLASLRELSTSTSILTDPDQLPNYVSQALRSEDPTALKPSSSRTAEPAVMNENIVAQIQDVGNTPYAWTIQFVRPPNSSHQSGPND